MDLSRALSILTGSAVPVEAPGEYDEAAQVALAKTDEIEAALERMGYTPERAQAWTTQLRRVLKPHT